MRKSIHQHSWLLCLVTSAISATMVSAQMRTSGGLDCPGNTSCPDLQVSGSADAGPVTTVAVGFGLKVVKGRPYQAQATTEMTQTLADGSHIVQSSTATVARDGQGRTVRIQQFGELGPLASSASAKASSPTLTTIFDPVDNVHIDFTSSKKIAHVMPLPPATSGKGGEVMASGGNIGYGQVSVNVAGGGPMIADSAPMVSGTVISSAVVSGDGPTVVHVKDQAPASTESLGSKTMEGLAVTGTRNTSVIKAGTIGNDKDIVTTHETWYSADLQLVVESITEDPRFGKTTYTLKNLQQGEPDATLFQIPADYKVDHARVFVAPPN